MNWTRDTTGRFRQRPHYLNKELEQVCEDAIYRFLQARHGRVTFPISTADLTVLIEQNVADLDSYSELEDDIDGLTDFFPRKKPRVKIAARLQEPRFENRLRTTLTHEYGHVILHGFMFAFKMISRGCLTATRRTRATRATAITSTATPPIGWNGRPGLPAARCSCRRTSLCV